VQEVYLEFSLLLGCLWRHIWS